MQTVYNLKLYLPIFRQTTLPTTPKVWYHHVNHESNHLYEVVEFAENRRLNTKLELHKFQIKIVVTARRIHLIISLLPKFGQIDNYYTNFV